MFRELIVQHYDPVYQRSNHGFYTKLPLALPFVFRPNAGVLAAEAKRLLALLAQQKSRF